MSTPAWEVANGDCLDVMGRMREACVDAIVTDPPYGLAFMGKEWDDFGWKKAGISKPGIGDRPTEWVAHGDVFGGSNPTCETCGGRKRGKKRCACVTPVWRVKGAALSSANVAAENFYEFTNAWAIEALRVAKPGAHLLAFGGTRTYHRLACAIEDAGWEVRDQIAWLYGSGFPKSHNLDGDHEGWGTALKPAMEPVCVARKPLVGTVARNVETFGTGALNIDGTRIQYANAADMDRARVPQPSFGSDTGAVYNMKTGEGRNGETFDPSKGRWPANVVHDGSDEVLTGFPERDGMPPYPLRRGATTGAGMGYQSSAAPQDAGVLGRGDSGSAARFFYCAKAGRSEREAGLREAFAPTMGNGIGGKEHDPATATLKANTHPTVKPVALMRWLCRLVTPPGGIVLDPFTGSGTTGVAALAEGFQFVGIEREAQYAEIARARIANAVRP